MKWNKNSLRMLFHDVTQNYNVYICRQNNNDITTFISAETGKKFFACKNDLLNLNHLKQGLIIINDDKWDSFIIDLRDARVYVSEDYTLTKSLNNEPYWRIKDTFTIERYIDNNIVIFNFKNYSYGLLIYKVSMITSEGYYKVKLLYEPECYGNYGFDINKYFDNTLQCNILTVRRVGGYSGDVQGKADDFETVINLDTGFIIYERRYCKEKLPNYIDIIDFKDCFEIRYNHNLEKVINRKFSHIQRNLIKNGIILAVTVSNLYIIITVINNEVVITEASSVDIIDNKLIAFTNLSGHKLLYDLDVKRVICEINVLARVILPINKLNIHQIVDMNGVYGYVYNHEFHKDLTEINRHFEVYVTKDYKYYRIKNVYNEWSYVDKYFNVVGISKDIENLEYIRI